jgi:putative ABC transport system substrate-binding protein
MKRREFLVVLGSAIMSPIATRAQSPAGPVIGFINSTTPEGFARPLIGFGRGLGEEGFVEGRNVRIEYRWARGEYQRLPGLGADLIREHVNVIATTGGTVAALAAKDASATIPIVFELGRDPVEIGLVSSLNHPGGNITGINMSTVALAQKRIELLAELLPEAKTITMLVNPASPTTKHEVAEADSVAHLLGRKLAVVAARDDRELDQAFAQIAGQQASALVVQPEPYLFSKTDRLVALARTDGYCSQP